MGGAIWKGPYTKDHPMKSGRYSINLGPLLDDGPGDLIEEERQSPSEASKEPKRKKPGRKKTPKKQ